MKTRLAWSAVIALGISWGAAGAEKPRVFITESQALQLSGGAAAGDAKGSLLVTGGTSPQNVEVMKSFTQLCPGVVVTANREKADYVVRLDHEDSNPTTLFVKGNKVAVFNKDRDLVYSGSTRLLGNAVKAACAAITGH
jgi:hypothetical protein